MEVEHYANAFGCMNGGDCPESNGKNGCPFWQEIVHENQLGEQKLVKDCLGVVYSMLAVEVIKASNRPAAAVESLRNEMKETFVTGFKALSDVLRLGLQSRIE